MLTRIDKGKIIHQLKKVVCEEKDILFAYLHGSFLEESGFNDIDIALYAEEKIVKRISVVDFEISLSLKIEKIIRQPVDMKLLNTAPLAFKYQASRGRLLFSRDEIKREEFLCRTWSGYFDFLPLSRVYLKEALSG